MTKLQPYRILLAVVVLILYVLAATPVQVWHQHKTQVGKSQFVTDNGIHLTESGSTGKIHHCAICSHSYSAFIEPAHLADFELPTSSIDLNWNFLLINIPDGASIGKTNKGPPAQV